MERSPTYGNSPRYSWAFAVRSSASVYAAVRRSGKSSVSHCSVVSSNASLTRRSGSASTGFGGHENSRASWTYSGEETMTPPAFARLSGTA